MSEESDLQYLLEMGFSVEKCQRALKVNNNKLQEALEWLLVHGMEPDVSDATMVIDCSKPPNETLKLSASAAGQAAESVEAARAEAEGELVTATVNSLKCDDCGVLLKDEDFATLHAHKTGHVNFSQSTEAIKPKTKEEIAEQKQRLQEKLVHLRAEKQRKEKEDEIEREKSRRKDGRQLNEIKQKFHEDEMKRVAEQKRREKIADAEHKIKLKEQIAADREAKKAEAASEAAKAAGLAPPPPKATPAPVLVTSEKKDYQECRIQVRLTDGKVMQQTFKAGEQLAAVRLWLEMNRTDGTGKFSLMQAYPRKVYTDEDMMRTLVDLGLLPASSLVITRA